MDIDLEPHQWKSEREKPREPIFGPGFPNALAYAVGWLAMGAFLYWLRL